MCPDAASASGRARQALKLGITSSETWPVGYGLLIVEQIAALYYKEGKYGPAASVVIRGLDSRWVL